MVFEQFKFRLQAPIFFGRLAISGKAGIADTRSSTRSVQATYCASFLRRFRHAQGGVSGCLSKFLSLATNKKR
jgi:hypothetical protein